MWLREPDQRGDAGEDRVRGELLERGELPLHEFAQCKQVLGRVAAERELGKDDELRARLRGIAGVSHDGGGIVGERSHGRIDLSESDLHAGKITHRSRRGARRTRT